MIGTKNGEGLINSESSTMEDSMNASKKGNTVSDRQKPQVVMVKPLQSIPYNDKVANNNEWGKQCLEYFLNSANFRITVGTRLNNLQIWYDAYNNRIDETIYNYVTNPLNTNNQLYKNFPARLRPYNILRPNIDLLIGEWNKKPFKFDVVNTDGDGAYNAYIDERTKVYQDNLIARFNASYAQLTGESDPQKVPDPKTVADQFEVNYKDASAIEGYKSLRVLEFEKKLKETYRDCIKDYLIGGEIQSLKFVKFDDVNYQRLSPMWLDYDKSPLTKNIEDGDWAVIKFRVTVSDLVDLFYEELKEEHLLQIEKDDNAYRKRLFFNLTNATSNSDQIKDRLNKLDLYYACWKSRRKIGFLTYNDPFSGQEQKTVVSEEYKPQEGEKIVWEWVNEAWEGWRINDDIYLGIKPVEAQRNELNNFSYCKLPINGRRFSDTESVNVSPLALGMPYQIMYTIMMYRIELAIARSKNDIMLLDKNVIPDDTEESEDKFFYYAEALGYMLIDRSQDNVDRTMNQYQVLKFSTFQYIKELIEIANFYKTQWDELLGISYPRKGQVTGSDGLGVNQEAIFRSTVISDIIMSTFDEWVQSELQGLIDLTKFAWVKGKKAQYRTDDGKYVLADIDGNKIANSSIGVFVASMGQDQDKLNLLKNQINAISQRKDVKLTTIADLIWTDSYAEITAKLKRAEEIEAKIIEESKENEHERALELEQLKKDYDGFKHVLDKDLINVEADRLDNREYIKGEVETQTKIATDKPVDLSGVEKQASERLNRISKETIERERTIAMERIENQKAEVAREKIAADLKKASQQRRKVA